MAVINVVPQWTGRSGGFTSRGEIWTSAWTVLLDGTDPVDSAHRIALGAAGIPAWNDPAPWSPFVRARSIDAEPKSTTLFLVTARYEPVQFDGEEPPGPTDDPTTIPPDIEYDEDFFTEAVDEDIDGDPITNSALEPYNPPLQRPFSDTLIIVSRNLAAWDASWWQPRKWHRNNASVSIDGVTYPAGTLLLRSAKARRFFAGATKYYAAKLELIARADLHVRRVLDQGTREWIASESNGTPIFKNIVDEDGNPVSEPVPLDGLGGKLQIGPPTNAPAEFLEWQLFPTTDYSSFPLSG